VTTGAFLLPVVIFLLVKITDYFKRSISGEGNTGGEGILKI
jgi:hypothetical protein